MPCPHCHVDACLFVFLKLCSFNFGSPRSDTCNKCDQFYAKLILASNDEEHKQIETDSKLHHYKAEQAYKTLAADASKKNFIAICVDL